MFQCINCRKYYKADEGNFLNKFYNTDFLCNECEGVRGWILARGAKKKQDEERKELERQQALEIAKQTETKILNQQKFHNDYSLELNETEPLTLPNFPKISNVAVGFRGEVKPCSGYIMRYGEKGATPTKIYLTFNISQDSRQDYYVNYQVNYVLASQVKYFCVRCSKQILSNWYNTIDYDYYQNTGKAEKELAKIKERVEKRYN